jgi:hypothetical protein
VADNLDIHRSESLVRYVAERDEITQDLGVKYVCGILRSRTSRAAFLADPGHSIRVALRQIVMRRNPAMVGLVRTSTAVANLCVGDQDGHGRCQG